MIRMLKNLIKWILKLLSIDLSIRHKDGTLYWPKNRRFATVVYEESQEFHEKYYQAQLKTDMLATDNALRRMRHYTLIQLFDQSSDLDGDVVECGVFHGLAATQIAESIKAKELIKEMHIFDSFEGLSEIQEKDQTVKSISNSELRKQFSYGLEQVKQNLGEFDFIKLYKGWIPSRFEEVEELKFSFVHIDLDLYQPIKESFEFFYPRVVSGGIIVFDDYGQSAQFPGAKKAIDEVLEKVEYKFFINLPSRQAFFIN